jgi:hypothetical protein
MECKKLPWNFFQGSVRIGDPKLRNRTNVMILLYRVIVETCEYISKALFVTPFSEGTGQTFESAYSFLHSRQSIGHYRHGNCIGTGYLLR